MLNWARQSRRTETLKNIDTNKCEATCAVGKGIFKHTIEIMKGADMEEYMENGLGDRVVIIHHPETGDCSLMYEDDQEMICEHKSHSQCYNVAYRMGYRE